MGDPKPVAELFAGVGGFRLGLQGFGWDVVWSNQWEPSTKAQHASRCYVKHFGPTGHINEDIVRVLDQAEDGAIEIPDVELVCAGFPCQDYSVAKTLSDAKGLEGKKGVLWWEIVRFLKLKRPKWVLLENVDRLLKSPATQRGRDFAIIVATLNDLGYAIEWRVVNAADYGFPQRRRRVFIVASASMTRHDGRRVIARDGVLAQALPAEIDSRDEACLFAGSPRVVLAGDLADITNRFGSTALSPFKTAGYAISRKIWTENVTPVFDGRKMTLSDVLQSPREVESHYYIPEDEIAVWRYLKGAKRIPRTHATGRSYDYAEGAIAFPDPLDRPARTILTGEGGRTPSRFKHVIQTEAGMRRLTPIELERLNGFPDGWTDTGMPPGRRAFMMGNALVVGLVTLIGNALRSAPFPEDPDALADVSRCPCPSKR